MRGDVKGSTMLPAGEETRGRPQALPKVDPNRLAELCKRFHVRRLSVFGSVLAGRAGEGSDLDLLVEFEPGRVPGFGFFELQAELAELFGVRVDLHTPAFLSRYFRDEVTTSAELLYAA